MNVLVIDVGGTHVKILATGRKTSREFVSGPAMTAKTMADAYDVVYNEVLNGKN